MEEERAMKGSGIWAMRQRAIGALGVAVLVAACGSSSHSASGVKGGSEVQAQAIKTSGANPFTASVGKDKSA
jgi:hypothetical protein